MFSRSMKVQLHCAGSDIPLSPPPPFFGVGGTECWSKTTDSSVWVNLAITVGSLQDARHAAPTEKNLHFYGRFASKNIYLQGQCET